MSIWFIRRGLVALCLAGSTVLATAQEAIPANEVATRPRIGIALGGGSARGVAHVGVLRWLEEHRVPVDVIAGTSMGAFIGGAYATGMSASEIQSMLIAEDWERMLRPDLSYELKSFRRKEDDLAYAVKLDLGLRHGLQIQSGLNSGHGIGMLLSRVTLPYSTVASFDDLAIPFRCVATDLETGESIALARGPLATALRASMALPGTFEPVTIDGRLLADGGILNNVPVDVAKSMGADIVIAVSVSAPKRDKPGAGIRAVANRAIRLMMEDLDKPRLDKANVVLLPDIEGFGASAFSETGELAARGYAAAEAQATALLPYALDAESWERYRARQKQRRQPHAGAVSFIEVTGVSAAAADQIARRMNENPATASDPEVIESHLDWVIGHGRYASAMYHRGIKGEKEGLIVDIADKSYAPPLVKFSLDLDNENKDINLAAGARITFMDVTSLGSELRADLSAGSTLRVATELLQPIGGSGSMRRGPFFAPRVSYTRINENLYDQEELAAIYSRQRVGGGLDAGWLFGRTAQVRIGYDAAYVKNEARLGEFLQSGEGAERSFHAGLQYDGQNRAYFPTSGFRLGSKLTWFTRAPDGARNFGQLEGNTSVAFRAGARQHVTLRIAGGTSFGDQAPPALYQFTLGGPFRMGAFAPGEFRGGKFLLGGLTYRAQVGRLPTLLGDRLYLTGLVEVGSVFERAGDAEVKTSVTAGLSADTFFGPFFLGASVGNGGAFRAYFIVGSAIH